MYDTAANAYKTQQVQGASPALQVAMLYERAITSLHEAVDAIERGDVQARWTANKRATDILTALSSALDPEQGGEIADNLAQLYTFLLRRLIQVDVRNDPAPAKEAIELLEPLRDSWFELNKQDAGDGSAAAPAAASRPREQPTAGAGQRNYNLAI